MRDESVHPNAAVVVEDGYLRAKLAVKGAVANRDLSVVGFDYSSGPCVCGVGHLRLGLPLWFVGVLLAAYPAACSVHRWRQRRRRQLFGWCLSCGYDLQGIASPRCPECGKPLTGKERPTRGCLARAGMAAILGSVVMASTIAVPLPCGTDSSASPILTTRGIPFPFLCFSPDPNAPGPWELTSWKAGVANMGFWVCLVVGLAVAADRRRSSGEGGYSTL